MKKWIILAVIFPILFIGGYLLLSLSGVKFIERQLKRSAGDGFIFGEIGIRPTYLSVKDVQYQDPQSRRILFQSEEMRVYPDIFASLRGSLRIREWSIFRPRFSFYRSRGGDLTGPWVRLKGHQKDREKNKEILVEKKGEATRIKIDRVRIRKGSINFEDAKPSPVPANIGLTDLDLEIEVIQFPLISCRSLIELNGKMRGINREGTVQLDGWMDIETTDMEISLKAHGVDVRIFEPYYRKRVSAEVASGYVNLESKITVKKKTMDAPGNLELTDLRIGEEGTVFWVPAKTLASLLENKENRIKVKFHVNGNMDDPQFDLQESFLNRVGFSLAENLGIPVKVVGKIIAEGGGKDIEGLAKDLKSIAEMFKKKEKGK